MLELTDAGRRWRCRLTRVQIRKGRRVSAATSYLAAALRRANLDVVVNTRVTKVFPIAREQGKPVFRGVQVAQTVDGNCPFRFVYARLMTHLPLLGPLYNLTATKEVILSAGSTNTPHIRSCLWTATNFLRKLTKPSM